MGLSKWQSPPLRGFFLFERRAYTTTQVVLMAIAMVFALSPNEWFVSDPLARWVQAICDSWPKMAHDSEIIGIAAPARAAKYVFVSLISSIVAFVSAVTILTVMVRMGVGGPKPYYIRNNDTLSFLVITLALLYIAFFDQWLVGLEGRKARVVFGTNVVLFYSAAIIGLCGACIIRTVAVYCRRRLEKNGIVADG